MKATPATAALPKGLISLAALTLAGWGLMLWSVANMSSPVVALMMPMSSAWSIAEIAAVSLMWIVMMAAMMLPSAIPMLMVQRGILAKRAPGRESVSRWFLTGYLLAWTVFSLAAAVLHWGLQHAGILSPMIKLHNALAGGSILILAGAVQFAPPKTASLNHCRRPHRALLAIWRDGRQGALRMGLDEGLCCIRCCWAMMLLLFVGGAMSLTTIFLLSAAVAVEKLAPKGQVLARLGGIVTIAWGLWLIVGAFQGASASS